MVKPNPVRNSLQAVLERQARPEQVPVLEHPPAQVALTPMPATGPAFSQMRRKNGVVPPVEPGKFQRPSREGRRLIAGHFDPKVAKQIKLLAAEEDTTVQALLEEALDLLFVKKGKNTLTRA